LTANAYEFAKSPEERLAVAVLAALKRHHHLQLTGDPSLEFMTKFLAPFWDRERIETIINEFHKPQRERELFLVQLLGRLRNICIEKIKGGSVDE
jgi:hypothetical protein